ncbi:hypothetical protein BBJ28_00022521 [Nothophytophthora sp. Chile5]|nr:hypothetical protein BBJ28_00022521 [Nothophytophthora sp. Chile5]
MVLKEDVPKLGFRGEEVAVKAGYARNYLYPEKLAVYATDANREKFKVDKSSENETEQEKEREMATVIAHLSDVEVDFKRHTATKADSTLHSEVKYVAPDALCHLRFNISDMLEKQHGIIVGVARIDLPVPIKQTLGTHSVKVRVDDAIEAEYAAGVASPAAADAETTEGELMEAKKGPSVKKFVSITVDVMRR